jgi:FKBP-type peptidyl-prolyl cis-trans isomerase
MKRAAVVMAAMLLAGCDSETPTEAEIWTAEDLVVGEGIAAAPGDTLTVHYIGTLDDGTTFDNSYQRGQPFTFRLGAGAVIPGWDYGCVGMRVGGMRRLVIPPSLAYGDRPNGGIPGNSRLHFDIELIALTRPS